MEMDWMRLWLLVSSLALGWALGWEMRKWSQVAKEEQEAKEWMKGNEERQAVLHLVEEAKEAEEEVLEMTFAGGRAWPTDTEEVTSGQ